MDDIQLYQNTIKQMIVMRDLGLLSEDNEGEIIEKLDDIWRDLSMDQKQQIENWFKII